MSVAPLTTAVAASSKVLSPRPCSLMGFNVTSAGSAGYVLVYDLTAAPADGTVTPLKSYALASTSTLELGFNPPVLCVVGCTIVFSTTGPFTQTASATAFISGEVR